MRNLTILFSLFLSNIVFSQWSLSLSTNQEYNSNPFHYPEETSAFISGFNLGAEYEKDSWGLGYYGNYSNFSGLTDRNYYWHQIGFWNAKENFMFGIYAEQRLNQITYEYFNYSNFNGYIKHKTNASGINIFSQAAFTLTNYSELKDLNNWMVSASVNFNKSFETRTTLIAGLNFNYKNYYSSNLDTTATYGSGRFATNSSSSAYTTQLNYYFRVAQSLAEFTGLAIQYTNRNIVDGTAKTVRELENAYGDESQYFDDPISYEGYTLNAQLTQIFPSEIKARLYYYNNYKEYPSQGIYLDEENIDDSIIRTDEQQIFGLNISKSFYFENETSLHLDLGYQTNINSSNSFWYDYKANSFNFGIDYQF